MGKILIFVILAVTIPRWAATLAQVDKFTIQILGNPVAIAAIGEAIVLEFGNLYVLRQFTRCRQHAFQYHAAWEILDQRNREAEKPKTTRKPEHDPRIKGYQILPMALLCLETLTVLAQTPFIAGSLMEQPATVLLNTWGMWAVWIYAFLLVISPGIMTVAIGFAINYDEAMTEITATTTETEERQPLAERISKTVASLLAFRTARPLADHHWPTTGRPINTHPHSQTVHPAPTGTFGRPLAEQWPNSDRPLADHPATTQDDSDHLATTDRPVADHWPTTGRADGGNGGSGRTVADQSTGQSEAMAGHLADLQTRLSEQLQTGTVTTYTFGRKDVETWLHISRSHALNVIAYGVDHQVLTKDGRSRYRFNIPDLQPQETQG